MVGSYLFLLLFLKPLFLAVRASRKSYFSFNNFVIPVTTMSSLTLRIKVSCLPLIGDLISTAKGLWQNSNIHLRDSVPKANSVDLPAMMKERLAKTYPLKR